MDVIVKRSNRKTVSVHVIEGKVIVHAPYHTTQDRIGVTLNKHRAWIEAQLRKQKEEERIPKLTEAEREVLITAARDDLRKRVEHYAPLVGVNVNRIAIKGQKTKWASCSGKGNLNFNYLLMLAPEKVRDVVVVHELCHLKQMNHSPAFYEEIDKIFPDYKACKQWLNDNGDALMHRLPQ